MLTQQTIPDEYRQFDDKRLDAIIRKRREQLGKRLCILGHHYQRDEVIRHADFTGDSLKLSRQAAEQPDAEFLVFCGVHFMAESADILSADDQKVVLPNLEAGCAMADMADVPAVEEAIDELSEMTGERIIPVTYVNSAAAIKAATGRAGGACCTSSNAQRVFEWALKSESDGGAGGGKIFAIPDRHLGLNVAVAMGYSPEDCVLYEPNKVNGGLTKVDVERAKFILWRGYCYVHQLFTPEHVTKVRKRHDGIRVMVHPECTHEVVQLADDVGSTEQIIRTLESAESDSSWAIGTESNLVNRLATKHKDKFIRVLSDAPASCFQMARIDQAHLAWALDNLAEGNVVNLIAVEPEVAADARTALERMINI
ncbi:MAG: quinolinate synthase NadA [Planctomycetota bacterium]